MGTRNPDFSSLLYYNTTDETWYLSGDLVVNDDGSLTVGGVEVTTGVDLSGVTADAAELNRLDGVTNGTATASKAVCLDANKAVDVVRTASLRIGSSGSEVDYTAAIQELAAKCIGTATFGAPTAESGEARTVSVQLKDFAGSDLAVRAVVTAWVSTDANGDTPGDGSATIALSAGTDGALISSDDSQATFVSESDGDLDIVLTDSAGATQTVYLHIQSPLGEVFTSSAIAFAA